MDKEIFGVLLIISIIKVLFTIFIAGIILIAIYLWNPEGLQGLKMDYKFIS